MLDVGILLPIARATRVDFPGAWNHVLNRGVERRTIFPARRCCERFIELSSSLPKRFGVRLHGYVLMGNHYHLHGIHHNAVGIAIRRFTQRLKSDYTLLGRVSLIQKALETY
jgi:hypothetical protein